MTVLFIVFVLALAACGSQESVTAPVQPHPQAAKTGEAAVSEGSAETDRAVLVALYEAIGNRYGWDNWLCEVSLDEWDGVTTDENGRVTGLDLSDNDLSGPIPPELGNLGSLQFLDLGDNQLSGSIPSELGNLGNLQDLYLSYNDLSGCIPSALLNIVNNDLSRSGLSVCGDEDESTPVEPELAPETITGELTPEVIGLYGTLVSTFTNIFFAALVPGTTSVPGKAVPRWRYQATIGRCRIIRPMAS